MTRIGLVSDVHANLPALEAVLARLDAEGVDRIICLGDLVGYNRQADECVALVRARCDLVLAGNHDRGAIGALGLDAFPPAAREVIAWTRAHLHREHVRYLETLSAFAQVDQELLAVHGMFVPEPNDRFHLRQHHVPANMAALARRDARIGLFGHTHQPVVYVEGGGAIAGHGIVTLPGRWRYLVNPGSVGQPRDGDARAACAVLDRARGQIEFHRVAVAA